MQIKAEQEPFHHYDVDQAAIFTANSPDITQQWLCHTIEWRLVDEICSYLLIMQRWILPSCLDVKCLMSH